MKTILGERWKCSQWGISHEYVIVGFKWARSFGDIVIVKPTESNGTISVSLSYYFRAANEFSSPLFHPKACIYQLLVVVVWQCSFVHCWWSSHSPTRSTMATNRSCCANQPTGDERAVHVAPAAWVWTASAKILVPIRVVTIRSSLKMLLTATTTRSRHARSTCVSFGVFAMLCCLERQRGCGENWFIARRSLAFFTTRESANILSILHTTGTSETDQLRGNRKCGRISIVHQRTFGIRIYCNMLGL